MRAYRVLVFDEVVADSTTYSLLDFQSLLGSCDKIALHARVTPIVKSNTRLTVEVEHSADGANFAQIAATTIESADYSSNPSVIGHFSPSSQVLHDKARLAVTLPGGTDIAAVKIWAVGRGKSSSIGDPHIKSGGCSGGCGCGCGGKCGGDSLNAALKNAFGPTEYPKCAHITIVQNGISDQCLNNAYIRAQQQADCVQFGECTGAGTAGCVYTPGSPCSFQCAEGDELCKCRKKFIDDMTSADGKSFISNKTAVEAAMNKYKTCTKDLITQGVHALLGQGIQHLG